MNLKGIIHRINDTVLLANEMKKRTFIVKTEETYPQHISLDFLKDKCDILDSYKEGDKVSVEFNLNGRLSEKDGIERCFNSLNAWKIEKI